MGTERTIFKYSGRWQSQQAIPTPFVPLIRRNGCTATPFDAPHLVRKWHLADMPAALSDVRFWGQSGHHRDMRQGPLMTQSGPLANRVPRPLLDLCPVD